VSKEGTESAIALSRFPFDLDAGDLPEGVELTRWFKGVFHVVTITYPTTTTQKAEARGWWRYKYNGRRYKTLSAIAYVITGDRWMSGNRFFGLRARRGKCRPKISR
jgi:hypothetical protein